MEKIIVIGGGLMGSAVAWKLAAQGAEVLVLEQQGEVFEHGSSYGAARIARSLGPKKDIFSFVHNRTVEEVKKLIHFLNESTEGKVHKMTDIYRTSPVSYLYKKDQYTQIEKLRYKKQRKEYRKASGDAAFRKFGVTLKKDQVLVREFKEHSGTLNPHNLIQKLRTAIQLKGGQIAYHQKVTKLVKKRASFELQITDTQTHATRTMEATKVVLAAGPYTVEVLKDFAPYFNRIITPKRVLVGFYKIRPERYQTFSDKEIKSIVDAQPMFSQIGKEYYSMIEKWEEDGVPIFKAGGHKIRRNIIDMDTVWDIVPPKKELKWIFKQFKKYFEMLEIYLKKEDIEFVGTQNCVYSMTRTEVPLVTHIFNRYGMLDKNIVVIGGMSGVGAKGCLAYGTIGANLILGNPEEPKKMYRRTAKALGNAAVRLRTRRPRRGRLF